MLQSSSSGHGALVALLGPSGSGKTTLLEARRTVFALMISDRLTCHYFSSIPVSIGKCHESEALSGRTSRGDTATVFINGKAAWQGGSLIRLEGRSMIERKMRLVVEH